MKTIKTKDKNNIVLSVQSKKDYEKSHIQHSIFLDHKKLFEEGRTEIILKSPDEIAKILGDRGISNENNIFVYDEPTLKNAAKVYWVLKYLGVENVMLLKKENKEWRAARIPLTAAKSKREAVTFIPKVNTDITIDIPRLESYTVDGMVVIVDIWEEGERDKERELEKEK